MPRVTPRRPFLRVDLAVVREHVRLFREDAAILVLSDDEEDVSLGAHGAPVESPGDVRGRWAASWSAEAVAGLLERLEAEREWILSAMRTLPEVAPGPIDPADAKSLKRVIVPIMEALSRWTAVHRSFGSLRSVLVYRGVLPADAPEVEGFDPKAEPVKGYNALRDRFRRTRAKYKKRRAAYDATPERRVARAEKLAEYRRDPAWVAEQNRKRREKYALRRQIDNMEIP
ncbi:MAG: hypothetical protein KF764_03070 [Labilithrix sp.]|nr:hypothetical protein [Labilithrix sp.]